MTNNSKGSRTGRIGKSASDHSKGQLLWLRRQTRSSESEPFHFCSSLPGGEGADRFWFCRSDGPTERRGPSIGDYKGVLPSGSGLFLPLRLSSLHWHGCRLSPPERDDGPCMGFPSMTWGSVPPDKKRIRLSEQLKKHLPVGATSTYRPVRPTLWTSRLRWLHWGELFLLLNCKWEIENRNYS